MCDSIVFIYAGRHDDNPTGRMVYRDTATGIGLVESYTPVELADYGIALAGPDGAHSTDDGIFGNGSFHADAGEMGDTGFNGGWSGDAGGSEGC